MDFDLNTEQKMLKESARNFLSREIDSAFVREMVEDKKGFTKKIWEKMAELDWTGLMIPEEYNGAAMSFLDMAVILEEMGYACLPGPYFSTAVLGVLILLECGDDRQKERLLPKIAGGKHLTSLAWLEEEGSYTANGISVKAAPQNDSYILSGTKLFVADAYSADTLICAVRTDDFEQKGANGISLFLVETNRDGLGIENLKTMHADKLCEVTFDQVVVPKENLLGELNQSWGILEKILLKGAVAKCAEMIGGARRVLEMVVAYAKERYQFGKPIGSFQAIQHHCADMLTYLTTTSFMTYQAAWRISEELPHDKEASMAKAMTNEYYLKILRLGHQVMGGVGFMEEFDLQLYFRQARAAELAYGEAEFHWEKVACQLEK